MKKIALITGITGQDGSYLANFLLNKGYIVYGAGRRNSTDNTWRLNYFALFDNENFKYIEFDLTDLGSCLRAIKEVNPDEIYNLAAQSFVSTSFHQPALTTDVTGKGLLNILEAVRLCDSKAKIYQASSSEMFGKVCETPQNEGTKFNPRSPYGVSKVYAHYMAVNYRESYEMFICSGILFNHESPIRGLEFVTRKITNSVAKIKNNKIQKFSLGNLNAKRDWGFAGDYVQGMWMMLQQDTPDDYVLATNHTITIREFLTKTFSAAEIDILIEGEGINEKVIKKSNGQVLVDIDKNFFRPAEVDLLIGDYSKADKQLGWQPKVSIDELCLMMFQYDLLNN